MPTGHNLFGNNSNQSKNSIHEKIKSRLKSWNACYHYVQNLLFSSLLSKNINIYRTVIFPFVLYACETWSRTLGQEHRLRIFNNRLQRTILERRGNRVVENTP